MIAQAYEGACIDQFLGKPVVFLFGTINPVDTVGLGEFCRSFSSSAERAPREISVIDFISPLSLYAGHLRWPGASDWLGRLNNSGAQGRGARTPMKFSTPSCVYRIAHIPLLCGTSGVFAMRIPYFLLVRALRRGKILR